MLTKYCLAVTLLLSVPTALHAQHTNAAPLGIVESERELEPLAVSFSWATELPAIAVIEPAAWPHAGPEFVPDQNLIEYFGAGIDLGKRDGWLISLQGGAYFQDNEQAFDWSGLRLDDLDRIDREAVGERHARSIRPVGHLVIRKSF